MATAKSQNKEGSKEKKPQLEKKQNNNSVIKRFFSNEMKIPLLILIVILVIVTVVRMLFNYLPCYKIDMGGYRYWAGFLADPMHSFKEFYRNTHCVYGPFYMYFLYITGKLFNSTEFFVKFWSVLSDVAGGVLIYFISKKYKKQNIGLLLGILYAFNPAMIFNSSVWGQFDSFTATLLLAVVYLFNQKKTMWAVFAYAVAALTKPQSIAIFPMVVVLYFKDFPWKKFAEFKLSRERALLKSAILETIKKLVLTTAGCMLIYFILVFPFYKETSFYFLKEMEVYGNTQTASNLAQKVDFKSSEDESSSNIAGYASDMDTNTAWSSGHSSKQWIYADLGKETDINKVTLKWGWEYAKKYDILVSDDSVKWKVVHSEANGGSKEDYGGKLDEVNFEPVKARYVKLECKNRPFPYGLFDINENTSSITKAAYKFTDFYFWLVHQYSTSLNDYPYATANGYNFWMVQNRQTSSDKEPFLLGLNCLVWGYVLWGVVSLFAIALLIKKKKSAMALYYSGYFLTSGIFVFATKMHERYLLPAIVFATICILWDKRMIIPSVILSACCLVNQWQVYLRGNEDRPWMEPNNKLAMFIAWVTLIVMLASVVYTIWLTIKPSKNENLKVKRVAR
ncbi:MAG: discoidin domain-containing protein [Bacillota bacterium]|nr:discoidin domain-containing protein [Bacillota bacterium]